MLQLYLLGEKRGSGRAFPSTNRFMQKPKDDDTIELGDDDIEFIDDKPIAPHLPPPRSAVVDVSSDATDYKSPFGVMGLGSIGSTSWDDVPAWARDASMMPRGDGGSMAIPKSPTEEPPETGLSPVGAQWTPKDLKGAAKKTRGPGMLGRIFGRKSK